MSNDAVICGRQKKWKFIILLLGLSAIAVLTALGMGQKEKVISALPVRKGTVSWSPAAGRAYQTAVTDSGVYLLTDQKLTNLTASGQGMELSPAGDTMVGGFCLVVYESLGKELSLLETGTSLPVPGRIAFVTVGRKQYLAAILAASGCRTKTLILTATGERAGEITLKDKTMVSGVFLDSDRSFAALCIADGGLWELNLYTPQGEELWCCPLDGEVGSGLFAMDDYAVVCSNRGITVISLEGEVAAEIPGNPLCLAVTRNYIACVSEENLQVYLPDGSLIGEFELFYFPKSVTAWGNRIYIQYGEGTGCYSSCGEELWFRTEGAQALGCVAWRKGCWLIPYENK